jgi:hypothetical protein
MGETSKRSNIEVGLKATSQWSRKKFAKIMFWTVGRIWQGQHANHKDFNIEKNLYYKEVVVEMNILVGDDHVKVKKLLKKNEKWEATKRRERSHRKVSGSELGLGLQFHSILGKQWVIFHPSIMRHAYKIDFTKHTPNDPYSQPLYYFYKK